MLEAAAAAGLRVLRLTVERSPADVRFEHARARSDAVPRRPVRGVRAAAAPGDDRAPTTGFEDVQAVALARLLVDVPSIQVDWALYGPKLAQVALTVGADDVDGVSPLEETRRRPPARAARGDSAQHPRRRARAGRARRPLRAAPLMTTVRLGAVAYLNARPLVVGLGRAPDRFDLRYDLPAACARLLHAATIDLGLIPSHRVPARGRRLLPSCPDCAITSRGPVASVAIFTRVPIARHPLDRAGHELADVGGADARAVRARTSASRPRSSTIGPDLAAMLARARRGADHRRPGAVRGCTRRSACRRSTSARSGRDRPACRSSTPSGPAGPARWTRTTSRRCRARRDEGDRASGDGARGSFRTIPARQAVGGRYLRDNIRYDLGDRERAGLERFYSRAVGSRSAAR